MNNKITYHKVGDYYLPNLYLAKGLIVRSASEFVNGIFPSFKNKLNSFYRALTKIRKTIDKFY